MSTDEAVRSAAQKVPNDSVGQKAPQESAEPAVLEFQSASRISQSADDTNAAPSNQGTEQGKEPKKPPLKNTHGSAYGALDANAPKIHKSGASAGVGSKTGKSHIYVETDRSHTTEPSPH